MTPPAPPLSKARRAGPFLFLSGQMARDASGQIVSGGIAAQTRQAMNNIKAVLAANDANLGQVVKVTVWLRDPADYAEFNKTYAAYFNDAYPARSTVVSALVAPDAAIEIEALAWLG